MTTILLSIQLLMNEPNPDDPLIVDIADEFRYQKEQFLATAKEWCCKYARQNVGHLADMSHVMQKTINEKTTSETKKTTSETKQTTIETKKITSPTNETIPKTNPQSSSNKENSDSDSTCKISERDSDLAKGAGKNCS